MPKTLVFHRKTFIFGQEVNIKYTRMPICQQCHGIYEPGSSLISRTRVKTLAHETIIANTRFFDSQWVLVQVELHNSNKDLYIVQPPPHMAKTESSEYGSLF
ncbi:hypothetical protein BDA99DRAFT_543208 [Phascolomyces articulosus]|uniref:Uncharacterized protein n=1 Tax=Phascolomyces articulosus TaxID=60185 RepID=A0AAD5JZE6_9FUNG|nr:hypothetical protein BDA99DRAFT_543208 [Phascolomyces articulosus]